MNPTLEQVWRAFLSESRGGDLDQALAFPGFEVAARLPRLDRLADTLAHLRPGVDHEPDPTNLAVVAGRTLLGREAELLQRLAPVWERFGTPPSVTARAARLCRAALAAQGGRRAFAEFVRGLADIQESDQDGPLGQAVAASRYRHGDTGDAPYLAGEAGVPVGFPVVVGAAPEFRFTPGVWVTPQPVGPVAPSAAWDAACGAALAALHTRHRQPRAVLAHPPEWWPAGASPAGCEEDLASATLALAVQSLADEQGWPVPAGVGLTGRLVAGQLLGVRGLTAKARAAREAGVWVLFACIEPGEQEPREPGVHLERLPPRLTLREIVRHVNRVCAERGLTRHRVERWAERGSVPGLAEEVRRTCPVGFVGRETQLAELGRWLDDAHDGKPERVRGLVLGGPRSGKSTLLARWVDRLPDAPAWFRFRRGSLRAGTAAEMERALAEQLTARHCALVPPDPGVSGDAGGHVWALPCGQAVTATTGPTDVVIDGLDEAAGEEHQRAAVAFVARLAGRGLAIVSSQDIPALPGAGFRICRLGQGSGNELDAARGLIRRFAELWLSSEQEAMRAEGERLARPNWVETLAERSGGNLWVLTDFLGRVSPDGPGLPDEPGAVPVSADVSAYCLAILDEVAPAGSDLRGLVVRLAVLEEYGGPFPSGTGWPMGELAQLLGLGRDAFSVERAFAPARGRLVALRDQRVSMPDPTFRQVFAVTHPEEVRNVAGRLVAAVDGAGDLARLAAAAAPRIVIQAGSGELAARLVRDTTWASRRLIGLACEGRPARALLAELHALSPLLGGSDLGRAVTDLTGVLGAWGWAVDLSRECAAAWWGGLTRCLGHAVWSAQVPPADHSAPVLLLPESPAGTGYATPAVPDLTGRGTELPGGRLVLSAECGFLAVLDSPLPGAPRPRLLGTGVRRIVQLAPSGRERVFVLADGWDGRRVLLRVGFDDGIAEDLTHLMPEPPESIAAVELDDGSAALVAAGGSGWVRVLRDGYPQAEWQSPEPVWFDAGNRRGTYWFGALVAFAPGTWAALARDADGVRLVVQRLVGAGIEVAADTVVSEWRFPGQEDEDAVEFDGIAGACAVSGERLALVCHYAHDADRALATVVWLVSRDGEVELGPVHSDDGKDFLPLVDAGPPAWHRRLGLVFDNDVAEINTWSLDTDGQPRMLPDDISPPGVSLNGTVMSMRDGGVLVVHPTGFTRLHPSGEVLDRVPASAETGRRVRGLEGTRPGGAVLVNVRQRMFALPVQRGAACVALSPPPEVREEEVSDEESLEARATATLVGSDGTRCELRSARSLVAVLVEGGSEPVCRASQGVAPLDPDGLILDDKWSEIEERADPVSGPVVPGAIVDVTRQLGGGWRVETALLTAETPPALEVYETLVAGANAVTAERPVRRIPLRAEQVCCHTVVGGTGWVAISYESGRVDVINARTERNPLAIGFTAAPPVGLATSDSDKGLFLAVAAGEVIWFRLPRPGDVAGWTATSRENPSSAGTSSNT